MTSALRGVLEREYALRRDEQEYVFTFKGERLRSNVSESFRRIVDKAGLGGVTLHSLRHAFDSHLAIAGVPLMHIQQLLGHQDYKTTLIYTQLSTESHKRQVHRLPFGDDNLS